MNAVLTKMVKGITVCYSEVFPDPDQNNDYFQLNFLGKLFLIADSYCMNPDCTCKEAVLNFVQAYPEEGRKADSFMIRLKLNGRGYKIHDRGRFSKREIQAIVMYFTADGTFLELLNERYNEMKEKAKEILS
ncbi:hypothetical protein [Neobacillus vireti]|uniref:Uncharacterized protein n=1 Tax=Neobacillus vireti LMG 21834 TaxID=1131730 RepID=A0AB94IHY6_9BACI|nr:hypothetical protein [Neobacillus vireti]ETI66647.1 hypothetical protein BAVI_21608 [Neobacillus vireti LMG 21834]KLT18766.1 hypothetical protein AA980_06890 [Neobacillus vireti]